MVIYKIHISKSNDVHLLLRCFPSLLVRFMIFLYWNPYIPIIWSCYTWTFINWFYLKYTKKHKPISITITRLVDILWNNLSYTSVICILKTCAHFKTHSKNSSTQFINFVQHSFTHHTNCFRFPILNHPLKIVDIPKSHRQFPFYSTTD